MEDGAVLEPDMTAYRMLHQLNAEWPCLSFDIIPDTFGNERRTFPHTLSIVAGSQADNPEANKLYFMTVSNLSESIHDSDEEEDVDVDEPVLEVVEVPHSGGVNRVRTGNDLTASWSDSGAVNIWNHSKLESAGKQKRRRLNLNPEFIIRNHKEEGYALDWSLNRLLSGSNCSTICLTVPNQSSFSTTLLTGHSGSVEDIQWSPNQENIFTSCSSDQTIKVWDIRAGKVMASVKAHDCDVNVISWNSNSANLLASGADDGSFATWDLRSFQNNNPQSAADYSWHRSPITSIEWNPVETSVLAASSDEQISIWDFALERDEKDPQADSIPPQLIFVHQGQEMIKEVHWHKQIPGVVLSTAYSGFNFFKTINT